MTKAVPSVSVSYAANGSSTKANEFGMWPMQERAYEWRGEQYLLIKSPPASGKSRALMFIALNKLWNQGLTQAIIVVPEKTIGASFHDAPLSRFGFRADWHVEPKWNLCNAPGSDNGGKVNALGAVFASDDKVLGCTHATFRFAVEKFGVEAFDNRLIAVDEFRHASANPDNRLGRYLGQFIARDRVYIVAMTGSYFRGDAEAVLAPRFEFRPKHPAGEATPGFDYGEGGYDPDKCNVGVNEETGQYQIEIKGLTEPKSEEAVRVCREDLNEVIASFVQDKPAIERGLFDEDSAPSR